MARYTGPKNRIARKFGANIFGRLRNPLLHKTAPPGMHGAKRKKKSDYGLQLEEKQKIRSVYGMLTQKQLVKTYKQALKTQGTTHSIFLQLLECRLDNIVYRLRFAGTIFAAQQLVAHGHIEVDGKKVDIRSFSVRPGMTISVRNKSKNVKIIQENIQNTAREIPGYLTIGEDRLSGTLTALPEADQVPLPILINIPLVCEFLSHTN
jgi:small subunit ribosomal protein S4